MNNCQQDLVPTTTSTGTIQCSAGNSQQNLLVQVPNHPSVITEEQNQESLMHIPMPPVQPTQRQRLETNVQQQQIDVVRLQAAQIQQPPSSISLGQDIRHAPYPLVFNEEQHQDQESAIKIPMLPAQSTQRRDTNVQQQQIDVPQFQVVPIQQPPPSIYLGQDVRHAPYPSVADRTTRQQYDSRFGLPSVIQSTQFVPTQRENHAPPIQLLSTIQPQSDHRLAPPPYGYQYPLNPIVPCNEQQFASVQFQRIRPTHFPQENMPPQYVQTLNVEHKMSQNFYQEYCKNDQPPPYNLLPPCQKGNQVQSQWTKKDWDDLKAQYPYEKLYEDYEFYKAEKEKLQLLVGTLKGKIEGLQQGLTGLSGVAKLQGNSIQKKKKK